ncbi:MFS transporter [Pedosphaera parvula]|uniref:Major facilitator superfamily MFS_1 n=1 Tax=Pedosphaera parvula (strain Ellin514) TaxID=320771 RepID=B9XBR9_PEDPL|nr:MFS transporter [Pedosphaera parvula]EEF62954.1 major facilitator superfamily MFS_1 [Pedosphaera parvula Ellin514]
MKEPLISDPKSGLPKTTVIADSGSGFSKLFRWFKPAPHIQRLPKDEVDRVYPGFRWQIFESAYIGYASFYLVRNNLGPVMKEMGQALNYDKSMLGNIVAMSAISYGVGKFLMGYLSDRSNPRKFIAVGLILSAIANFAFGASMSYGMHLALWTLNGLIQGMGYGPCARGLGHWYTYKERGTIFGVWNTAHNIGGGFVGILAAFCAKHWGWSSAFYVPGTIACVAAVYLFWRMRDTPQSVGLPPIEEYKNEYPPEEKDVHEKELSFKELLVTYILKNKYLWLIAIANFFVYVARYSMVDWGPTYLKEARGATLIQGGASTTAIEFAGAGGMLLMGWISDKFQGRRGAVSMLCMIPMLPAVAGLIFTPKGMLWLDMCFLTIFGFLVYVPVMMLGVMSLDLTSKKAVGTAAGFVGLFGYIGRVVQGKGIGYLAEYHGWNSALYAVFASVALAIILLAFTWNLRPKA